MDKERTMKSIPELIAKKRDGGELTDTEIRFSISSILDGSMQDCQIGALLMAIWQRGMTIKETKIFTQAMVASGETLQWPNAWQQVVVDKHSTGGVGDKVSLSLVPALVACGCKVPMISGRGLSHTGGTLDKLEAIPGFRTDLSGEQILHILNVVGGCITGQTTQLVPADRIMYAIRDVTSTIDSIPLITASILSKKLSERLSALVLDVKYGKAAFCKTLKIAQELTEMLVRTGADLGLKIVAVLSQMDHPIGLRIGNALEVMETVECLHGKGPEDLNELVVTLGGLLLHNVGKAGSAKEGSEIIQKSLKDGSALSRFQAMLVAQGVELDVAHRLCQDKDFSGTLGQAPAHTDIRADAGGLVQDIDAMALAQLLLEMGAGRTATGGVIDHKVGVQILVPVGQPVNKGQPWIRVFHNHSKLTDEQMSAAHASVTIASSKVQTSKRITHIIRPEDLNLIEAEKHLTASTQ
uniref:thymidine phosphorylase isoform X1 n=1 Tax=Myxine glutinosa TaxID=7769 RepID=UPI00358EA413